VAWLEFGVELNSKPIYSPKTKTKEQTLVKMEVNLNIGVKSDFVFRLRFDF